MIKKIVAGFWLFCMASAGPVAMAAGLDDVFKVIGQVKKLAGDGLTGSNSGSPASVGKPGDSAASNAPQIGKRYQPDWLSAYPRAELKKESFNPFEASTIPLSMPEAGATSARYAVAVEGQTTILQYVHPRDDSPTLIQRHYEAVFAQQGFERFIACAIPCATGGYEHNWMPMLDPSRAVSRLFFPSLPSYLVAYKDKAIAVVAIGRWGDDKYASFIKIVDGRITNRRDLDAYIATLRPASAAQPAVATTRTASVEIDIVETIAPNRLQAAIGQTRGKLIVFLSSRDKACGFCTRAIGRYAELSKLNPEAGRYIAVYWEPWLEAFKHELLLAQGIVGIPTYLLYEDGRLINRVDGDWTAAELQKTLLTDRNPAGKAMAESPSFKVVDIAALNQMIDGNQRFVVQILAPAAICAPCSESSRRWDEFLRGQHPAQPFVRMTFSSLDEAKRFAEAKNLQISALPAVVYMEPSSESTLAPYRKSLSKNTSIGNMEPELKVLSVTGRGLNFNLVSSDNGMVKFK